MPACTIHGDAVAIETVQVKPDHAEAFEIGIKDSPVTATPTRTGAKVDIEGPLKLTGTVKRLWYTASADVTSDDGMVTLRRGAHVIGRGIDGARLVASVVLYANDVMPGEDKPADETVDSVRLSCDHLSLDWFADPSEAAIEHDATAWYAKAGGSRFVLYAEPHASARTVTYSYPGCEGKECLVMYRLDTRGAWTKLGAANESASVVGWIPTARISRAPDDVGFGHSYGCTGDHHTDLRFSIGGAPPRKVHLRQGAVIYAQRGAGAWATTTRELEVSASFSDRDTWAEIRNVPGVVGIDGHAFVAITALSSRSP